MLDTELGNTKDKNKRHPKDNASVLAHFFFCWEIPILVRKWKNTLVEKDLDTSVESHESKKLGDKLDHLWQQELFSKKPSLARALVKGFGFEFFMYGVFYCPVNLLLTFAQPLLLRKLLDFYLPNQTSVTQEQAFLYGLGIILSVLFWALSFHIFFLQLTALGMKIRIACSSLVYRKLLRLKTKTIEKVSLGHIINLLSNDGERLNQGFVFLHYLWITPLEVLLGVYFVITVLGYTAVTGFIVPLICLLLQVYISKKISITRTKVASKSDHRIRLIGDIICGIQAIKMYTWEIPFAKVVDLARRSELKAISSANQLRMFNATFLRYAQTCSTFLCVMMAVLLGLPLTSQYVFAVAAIYENLNVVAIHLFTIGVTQLTELQVSLRRIQTFLLSEYETPKSLDNKKVLEAKYQPQTTECRVYAKDVSVSWNSMSNKILNDVNFSAVSGEVVGITGATGSGKSTFLQVVLKEVDLVQGNLHVGGTMSYAPQKPWIFPATIRQNILFGVKFNEGKYFQVVKMCALEYDLTLFPDGDNTLVGERGMLLSGGQAARVSLARAMYRDADIYLLDDPFSAVDARVGNHIFNECILKHLKNKCVIFVTHQLQHLSKATKIYVVQDGKMVLGKHLEQLNVVKSEITDSSGEDTPELERHNLPVEVKEDDGCGVNAYKYYFSTGGKWLLTGLLILTIGLAHSLANVAEYFVTFWVNMRQESLDVGSQWSGFLTDENCLYIYGTVIVVFIVGSHVVYCALVKFCKNVSKDLHDELLTRLLKGSMNFFNNHSSGRIINRFSKDLGIIDEYIPFTLGEVLTSLFVVIGANVLILITNYWMVIPTTILFAIFYGYTRVFQPCINYIRRIEGTLYLSTTGRSPIFTQLAASVEGLTVIKVCKAQSILEREFDNNQNFHNSVYYLYNALFYTYAFWTNLTCVLYLTALITSFLCLVNVPFVGNVGLAITQSFLVFQLAQYGMKMWGELNSQMTSVERVVEYTDLTPERDEGTFIPPESWPDQGTIVFNSVSMRYSPEKSLVLKKISLTIQSGEKIGIVGRTGSGKTSLVSLLFRLFDFEGSIFIDGVDTKSVPLTTLRSKISVIPQDPNLFMGTLRKNLDPFDEFNDSQLWNVLEDVQLKGFVSDLPAGLESIVLEGGSNFSVGHKQLLCLVRVILRNSKIIVLDEATANVDLQTDQMIQSAIKRKFKGCTVLTVAHRVNTVMDSDKILVMDSGCVVEYGHPQELLQNSNGHFYKYVFNSHTGDNLV